MHIRYRGLFSFLGAILLLIVSLMLLNRLPASVQSDTARSFRTVDEVRSELRIREVRVPSYFPQRITWPPARILAQNIPFPAVLMEFRAAGTDRIALVVVQSENEHFGKNASLRMEQIIERVPHTVRGTAMQLVVGSCGRGLPCCQLAWADGVQRFMVITTESPFELVKIAESMIR